MTDRIQELTGTFASLLDQYRSDTTGSVSALIEAVRALQSGNADPRLSRMQSQLKKLRGQIETLTALGSSDFLPKIQTAAAVLESQVADGRATRLVTALVESRPLLLKGFSEFLLDHAIELTSAERGLVLFYLPESSEAEILAARIFETRNLDVEEHDFSRTLLRTVLDNGSALLVEDASEDKKFSRVASIARLKLRSVMAAPIKQGARTIGAIYLESRNQPRAFSRQDLAFLETAAAVAVFYLEQARLLPAPFDSGQSVFFDPAKAGGEIIGQDPRLLKAVTTLKKVANSNATVLLEGESGTGKELAAHLLHAQSSRRDHPFVAINCASIPDNLLESELFGYEKGAFTGAVQRRLGRIEQGNGGTIFLDEINLLPYSLQAKLLRFLQTGEFQRLGGKDTLRTDVRVVAASSRPLRSLVDAGTFQDSLYYRLKVIAVALPPLRERKVDVPLLAEHFLANFSTVYGKKLRMDSHVRDWLSSYAFPGNVRELENLIHRLVALADGERIRLGDLPDDVIDKVSGRVNLREDPFYRLLYDVPRNLEDLRERKKEMAALLKKQERWLAEDAIQQAGGNVTEAAKILGVHRITLHKMTRRRGTAT